MSKNVCQLETTYKSDWMCDKYMYNKLNLIHLNKELYSVVNAVVQNPITF